jgi:hypothetical protein
MTPVIIRNALWAALFLAVGCKQEKVTPQPEPVASSAPAPIATASASPGSQPQRARWRTTPNERFDKVSKECEEGSVKGCEEALILELEGESYPNPVPLTPQSSARVRTLAKRGCDLGSKLGCAWPLHEKLKKTSTTDRRWLELVREACEAGGDPVCLPHRTFLHSTPADWMVKGCKRGLATECLMLVRDTGTVTDWTDADLKNFAIKACDTYVDTCYDAASALASHPQRRAWPEVRALYERVVTEQSKRCAEGHATCGVTAHAMLELGRDYAEIRRYAEAGLEDEDPLAAYIAGLLAEEGLGQPADPATAAKYYRKCPRIQVGADRECHARLSAMYEQGRGVPKDKALAFEHAARGKSLFEVTPTVLRYARLYGEQSPPLPKEKLMKSVRGVCNAEINSQCATLLKLIEEGKPIPESLP